MQKHKPSGSKHKTLEQRKKATERTTPVVTRTSKNKLKPTETYESGQQATPTRNNIQNPTSTPTSSDSSFLNTSLSTLHAGPIHFQTPSYCLEPQTETQQPSTPVDTNQPSTSMGINLPQHPKQNARWSQRKDIKALENLQEKQTIRTIPQQQSLQKDGKKLKATLIALAKASHHKTFMETCLTRNQPPKNMKPWIEPHIYRSNTTIERKWRDILHNASLNLVSLLINHFGSIVQEETLKLRALEGEMAQKISHKQDETEIWATICHEAQEEATQLSTKLKESREKKLSYRRKRWTQEEDMEGDYSEPLQETENPRRLRRNRYPKPPTNLSKCNFKKRQNPL